MKVLVTGGTGMTGAYLLLKLIETGYNVKALHRKNSNLEITKKVFINNSGKGNELFSKINWTEGDLTDYNSVNNAMKAVDIVYHSAAMVSFKPSERDLMIHNNVQGTANVVNSALINNVKKLCHVSSVAALGDAREGEALTEETEKTNYKNVSGYAISKFRSEKEVWRAYAEGLNVVIVNPSIILGAGNWKHGSPRLIKTIWDGLKYYTKGENGFIYVKDVVNIMVKLTESDISGERFILNAENLPFRTVFNIIADNLNKKRPHIYSTNFMLHSLKIFDNIRYQLTGKEPRLTKHTLKSAQQIHTCSNEKIKQAINYNFKPVEDALKEICKIFLTEFEPK
ncbi:MAG: NAD-dependent epimerase/dehydratase family protein [Bacteroidales bacterium]|nr:NAD-dependent epimerase/dehydratase family protein [Bacteroidales bacterium]